MKNAIIFDLDGTLWDTVAPIALIWNQVFEKNNTGKVISEADVRGIMGKTLEETGRLFFPSFPEERRAEIFKQCAEAHCEYLRTHGARLLFDVDALAKLYAQFDLNIVSNCPCGYIEAFLESHHLATFFKDYEMSGRTGKRKGENITALCKRNAIMRCVYVGDTVGDETATNEANANGAKIPFIHAAYGFGTANHPDAVIQRFDELERVVKNFLE